MHKICRFSLHGISYRNVNCMFKHSFCFFSITSILQETFIWWFYKGKLKTYRFLLHRFILHRTFYLMIRGCQKTTQFGDWFKHVHYVLYNLFKFWFKKRLLQRKKLKKPKKKNSNFARVPARRALTSLLLFHTTSNSVE